MRRVATTLALALCLLGCGSKAPSGEPVQLLTDEGDYAVDSCWLSVDTSTVELIADPSDGTAIKFGIGSTMRAKWPPHYTGRRVGSEVVVLDPVGIVAATTGRKYQILWVSSAGRQMGDVICQAVPAPTPAQ